MLIYARRKLKQKIKCIYKISCTHNELHADLPVWDSSKQKQNKQALNGTLELKVSKMEKDKSL